MLRILNARASREMRNQIEFLGNWIGQTKRDQFIGERPWRDNAHALDGPAKQVAEVPFIACHEMGTACMDRSG
ncbi:MAG: hypothetical protein O2960_23005 [Verrucomicrobia bacterium]|nr:hypothetical protein [Verrucomicrobiota bacterium]